MESLYILIPVSLLFVGIAIAAWLWSVSHGQFEDLDKAASSILFEDSDPAAGQSTNGNGVRDEPR